MSKYQLESIRVEKQPIHTPDSSCYYVFNAEITYRQCESGRLKQTEAEFRDKIFSAVEYLDFEKPDQLTEAQHNLAQCTAGYVKALNRLIQLTHGDEQSAYRDQLNRLT